MSGSETGFGPALARLEALAAVPGPHIAAIDGRCGSGKTAFAQRLAENIACTVIHTDDYYLPMERRVPDWRKIPCANMDLMRLRQEVLEPFLAGQIGTYLPYDCRNGTYRQARMVPAGGLLLVEGSYAHHPSLADLYDERIFLTCDSQTQRRRLMDREGTRFAAFESTWIPLEERYIREFSIGTDCLVIDTSELV